MLALSGRMAHLAHVVGYAGMFMQDAFELVSPSYGWEHVIDHQSLSIHGSLTVWQDHVPQADWGVECVPS